MVFFPIAVVGAVYGYYRLQKYKQAKQLEGILPTAPVSPPAAGFAPSPAVARNVATAVSSVRVPPTLGQNLFAAVKSVMPSPSDVPSSRVPSSAYGTAAPPGPTPATPPGYQASGSIQFKL